MTIRARTVVYASVGLADAHLRLAHVPSRVWPRAAVARAADTRGLPVMTPTPWAPAHSCGRKGEARRCWRPAKHDLHLALDERKPSLPDVAQARGAAVGAAETSRAGASRPTTGRCLGLRGTLDWSTGNS